MIRNDILWKGLIENIFPDFIPFFLPQYQHLFDSSKPVEFLDKELQNLYPEVADLSDVRFVDKLVKVFTPGGDEQWVLIHIEVQGYYDRDFAERMYTYFRRILDSYGRQVTAIAIFTDDQPSFCPNSYEYSFAGTRNVFQFNTYKVLGQNETELEQSNNPFAIAILTVLLALKQKKQDDNILLGLKTALVKQLISRRFEAATIRSLFNFINRYVRFASPETNSIFEREIESLTGKHSPMGIEEVIIEMAKQEGRQEGWKEGKQEGKAEGELGKNNLFVENLLRSTDFSIEKIASLAGVSQDFIKDVKAKLNL